MNKEESADKAKLQHSIYRLNSTKLRIDFTRDVKSQLERLFVNKRAKKRLSTTKRVKNAHSVKTHKWIENLSKIANKKAGRNPCL